MKLKPKLTANVNIYTKEVNNVLSVPSKALHFTPTKETTNKGEKIKDCNGANKVWTKEGNVLKAYSVKVGMTNGIRTQILSGVKQGAVVITGSKAQAEMNEEADNAKAESADYKANVGPRLSVVVVSNGTAEQMDNHLSAILSQHYEPGFEVIVVAGHRPLSAQQALRSIENRFATNSSVVRKSQLQIRHRKCFLNLVL